MSDLEFQRELTPEQMQEALSLLGSKAGAANQNLRVGDLSPAGKIDPDAQSSTTMATQDRLPATPDPQHRKTHLNLVVAFYGLGIAAAGALALLSWSESALTPSSPPRIAHEQILTEAPAPAKGAPPVGVANPSPDQSPAGSERRSSTPGVAGSSPIGHANRDDDESALRSAANNTSVIPYAARSSTVPAITLREPGRDALASRKPERARWRARTVRVAAAKKQFWRNQWQARAEINGGECFFVCGTWRARRIVYEPPRNMTQ